MKPALDDRVFQNPPEPLPAILEATAKLGFKMASDPQTGCLLRTMAASKPGGRFLELGTGTGVGAAWLLAGMDADSHLETVDSDGAAVAIAREHLGADARIAFHVSDGAAFLQTLHGRKFDFIFADTWPGKYDHLEEALALLDRGAFYIIDDLLPQPSWTEEHAAKVVRLLKQLDSRPDLTLTRLCWATGLIIATKITV